MALISCPECSKEISDKASSCPNCGCPIASAPKDVTIRFPMRRGQLVGTTCYIYSKGKEIATIKQGEAATIECLSPIEIEGKASGFFGNFIVIANPGDKFNIIPRGLGKLYFDKVDVIVGGKSETF